MFGPTTTAANTPPDQDIARNPRSAQATSTAQPLTVTPYHLVLRKTGLDRHGYARSDTEHATRAILLISDLAHIYEGSQDHPFGPDINEMPSRTEPAPSAPADPNAVLIPADQVKNLLVALDIAADYNRDRAELCADCADQSCPACEWRLRDAQAYGHLSAQLTQTAEASAAVTASHLKPAAQPQPATDREAGQ